MRKRMMGKLRKISTMYYLRQIVACLLVYCILLAVPMQVALATVSNPDVVAGSAGISQGGNTTTVNMGSASAVINWDSLNTNSNEILQFLKASGNFAVLNRVIQGGATQFDGSLFGNQGHIIIVNPNGIVFGPTALIQAYKFTASALDIANTDFMNGIYNFTGGGVGEVANYGDISAEQVALIGKQVLNAGVISSPGGYVVMAAGDKVFLGQEGSNILVEVEGVTVPAATDAAGIGDVINEGTIEAAGGKIVLAAGDTFSRAIEGVDSLSLAVESGTGRVGQFGTLSTDGVEGDGGSITMTAGDVVALSSDSVTTANAGTNGDGGDVIVYSPDTALFWEDARIEAKGGSESGDGGFVEVSGKENFEIWGSVDTTAPQGETGTFLIDPTNITITDSTSSSGMTWHVGSGQFYNDNTGAGEQNKDLNYLTVQNQLVNNNVEVITTPGGMSYTAGWIDVEHSIDWSSDNSLTLTADDYIWVESGDPITNTGDGNLTLNAGTYINIDADIDLDGGSFTADSGSTIYIGDDIYAGGNITLMDPVILDPSYSYRNQEILAGGTLWAQGTITNNNSYYGNLVLQGGTQSILDGAVTIKGDYLTLNGGGVTTTGGGDLTLTAGKDLTTNAPIDLSSGHLEMLGGQRSGSADIDINANITAGSMRIKNGNDTSGEQSQSGIYVADGVRLFGTAGNVVVEAVHDIDLGTGVGGVVVEAAGDIFLNADEDGYGDPKDDNPANYNPIRYGGGDLHAEGQILADGDIDILGNDILLEAPVEAGLGIGIGDLTITGSTSEDGSTGWGDVHAVSTLDADGTIEISGDDDTIILDEDVTAGVDLLLNNDTEVAGGKTLKAGNDVVIAPLKTVKAQGDLTIEAGSLLAVSGGKIDAALSLIDMAVDGSTLDLKQNETLDMEASFLGISNRDDTDLVAKSTYGSVTSNQAAEWQSITADAYNSIDLTDIGGNITTKVLTAWNGNIEVTTDNLGQILAKDDITAHAGDVALYADGGIEVAAGKIIKAGRDVKIGYDVDTSTYDSDVTLTGEGALTVEADRHITLGGDVAASALTSGDLILWADKDSGGDPAGDMIAYGTITNPSGDIDIYSSDGTTELWDNVILSGDLTLHNSTVMKAAGKILQSTGDDVILAADKTLASDYDLTIQAADDILLGITNVVNHWGVNQQTGSGGNVSANGDLTMTAGDDIYAHGTLTTVGGDIDLTSSDNTIHLYDNVNADVADDGDIWLHSTTWVAHGKKLTAGGNVYVDRGKKLSSNGNLEVEAITGMVGFGGEVVTRGSLTVDAGTDIIAGDDVTASSTGLPGDLTMTADTKLDRYNGSIYAYGELTTYGGDIHLYASDSTIHLYDNVNADVADDGDIWLHNTTEVAHGKKLTAGGNVYVDRGKKLSSNGNLEVEAITGMVGFGGEVVTRGSLTVDAGTDIIAGDDVTASSTGLTGDLTMTADTVSDGYDGSIYAYGELTTYGGDIHLYASDNTIHLYDNVNADVADDGDIILNNNIWVADGVLLKAGDDVRAWGTVTGAGDLTIEAGVIEPGSAGDYANVLLDKWVTVDGDLAITAGDDITANGKLTSNDVVSSGDMTLNAGDDIYLNAMPESAESAGLMQIQADLDPLNGTGNVDVAGSLEGNMKLSGTNVYVDGTIYSHGTLDVDADDDIELRANVSSDDVMTMDAGSDIELNRSSGNTSSESTITLNSGDNVTIGRPFSGEGNVTANGYMGIFAGSDSDDYVKVFGKLTTTNGGNINVQAGDDIKLYGTFNGPVFESAQADGDLTLDAEDDLDVLGDLTSNNGSIVLSSDNTTTYLGGDVTAAVDITFNNNTVFDDGDDDQKVDAQTGGITAKGSLWKNSPWGSLYLEAAGDISLAGYVTADAGGVSIISETGTIFTPGAGGGNDTLNVPISGISNDAASAGVRLPHGPGRAAIVIMSADTLNLLGPGASLYADGIYDTTGVVDDREGVDFLDVLGGAVIGGAPRDEGDPFDAAIYLASTTGNVDVSSPVSIMSFGEVPEGTMVIDAYDTVTFGPLFEDSLAGDGVVSDVGDRLEVASRITEWLYQAVGRLPYVYGGGPFPLDYTYVLRGAGPDNPGVEDGWVLEDPTPVTPLYEEAGEGAERLTLGLAGCPVLVAAVSAELGVPGGTIQVSLANSFALNTNIQPCESCARLLNAATILRDEDGSGMAAMNQVFNTVAPAGVPFTPEMQALIATAFAGRVNDGTQYATAIEYIDAFVRYIAVLGTEMGSPVADGDSIAFVMGKYGTGITGSENSNIAAFIATRLESGATFGE